VSLRSTAGHMLQAQCSSLLSHHQQLHDRGLHVCTRCCGHCQHHRQLLRQQPHASAVVSTRCWCLPKTAPRAAWFWHPAATLLHEQDIL
jgi:hypothetical protein